MNGAQHRRLSRPDQEVGPGPTTTQDERTEALARSNLYRFLAGVYLDPPNGWMLEQLSSETTLEGLSEVLGREAVAGVRRWCAGEGLHESLPALRQQYMDLFAVPTGRYVTPFEDVYAGGGSDGVRGPLLGPRAVEVLRMHRACGVEMDRHCRELPTHIGVELSFMAVLCLREADALDDNGREREIEDGDESTEDGHASACPSFYRAMERQFLRDHLDVWFPLLREKVEGRDSTGFYAGLTALTAAFLKQDLDRLGGGVD